MSRYWLIRFLAVCFGLLLLLIVEVMLRNFQWLEDVVDPQIQWPQGMQEAYGLQQQEMFVEQAGVVRIHPSLIEGGFVQPREFNARAPQRRIFTFGGSATLGVPFEKKPRKTWPGKMSYLFGLMNVETEIINLGGASFGSAHVREFALQSLKYNPQALLIYSGNNEFFNYGLELLENNRSFVPQLRYVESIRLLRLLDYVLDLDKRGPLDATSLQEQQDQILSEVIAEILYQERENIDIHIPERRDRIVKEVRQRMLDNFTVVAETAAEQDIPVLIGLIPVNLLERPWMSLHDPSASISQRNTWNNAAIAARYASDRKQWEKAASFWQQAIQADPWPADAWFELALVKKELGLPIQKELETALELDFHPGRPTRDLVQALQEHSWPENVLLISFSDEFNENPSDLFHDSCHLTEKGAQVVADAFVQRLVADLGWGFSALPKGK